MSAARSSARADQAVVGDPMRGLCVGLVQDALGLSLRVGHDLVAVLRQATGGGQLIRDGHTDLIEDVQNFLLVDERARRQRQPRARSEHFLELVEQIQDVHGNDDNVSPTPSRIGCQGVQADSRAPVSPTVRQQEIPDRPRRQGSLSGLFNDHHAGRQQQARLAKGP